MSERKFHTVSLLVIAAAAMGALAPMLHLEHGTLAMNHLIFPVMMAFWGSLLLGGRYSGKNLYPWCGVVMMGWFFVSRALLGEPLLDESYTRMCGLAAAYLVGLPFASCLRDSARKHAVWVVAALYTAVMSVLGWLSVYCSMVGRIVTIPYLNTHINMSDGRLWMNTHPNTSGCMLLLGFMLGAWLFARMRSRLVRLIILGGLAGMYLAIALTVSRTVMIQLSCFMGGAAALIVMRLFAHNKWKRIALAALAAAVCAVLVFVSFSAAIEGLNAMHALAESTEIVAQREITQDLYTLTGRTDIYKRAVQLLTTQPRVLLLGILDGELEAVCEVELQHVHAHNSLLQTAVNYGLPALLIALALTLAAVCSGVQLIWSPKAGFGDQLLAGMVLVMLVGSITEPYLFTDNLTICNFMFMFILGYVIEGARLLRRR